MYVVNQKDNQIVVFPVKIKDPIETLLLFKDLPQMPSLRFVST